jgi:hypothetical protein
MLRSRWENLAAVLGILLCVMRVWSESLHISGNNNNNNKNNDCKDTLPEEVCDGFEEAGWCGTGVC